MTLSYLTLKGKKVTFQSSKLGFLKSKSSQSQIMDLQNGPQFNLKTFDRLLDVKLKKQNKKYRSKLLPLKNVILVT